MRGQPTARLLGRLPAPTRERLLGDDAKSIGTSRRRDNDAGGCGYCHTVSLELLRTANTGATRFTHTKRMLRLLDCAGDCVNARSQQPHACTIACIRTCVAAASAGFHCWCIASDVFTAHPFQKLHAGPPLLHMAAPSTTRPPSRAYIRSPVIATAYRLRFRSPRTSGPGRR